MKTKLIVFAIFLLLNNFNFAFSQMSLQWSKEYNGDGGYNYNDRPRGTVIDSHGNLIITGSSYDHENSPNFYITIKYDREGNTLWSKRLENSNFGTPYGITTDLNDNIYITGGRTFTNTQKFTVVKYSANGELKWTKNEDTLSNPSGNCGKSIVSDIYGNIYVLGYCSTQEGHINFLTVKYDSNGVKKWSSVYNHPSNNSDYPKKIILDNQNNVYVIGWTYVDGGGSIATILKYSNSGNLIWSELYDAADYDDTITDIVVDDNGNVFVTGASNINNSLYDYNFFTAKYNINGDSVWVNKFDGPGIGYNRSIDIPFSLKLDNNNDIIVSGISQEEDGFNDVRLIKYSSVGNEIWNNHFNFDTLSNDVGSSMILDNESNIYITGKKNEDYFLLKCNNDGTDNWNKIYKGAGQYSSAFINIDQQGNPLITGYSNQGISLDDYLTIKYDTSGSKLWERSFTTPGLSNDIGNSLAADNNGNIIITGKTESVNNKTDLIVLKYNLYGNLIWKNTFNYINSIYNEGLDITVDRSGNSFVTGYTTTSGNKNQLLILKYDSTGVLNWSTIYTGQIDSISVPKKIILDADDNVIVCGYTQINGQGNDVLVVKYNSANGNKIWEKTYNNINFNGNDEANDIAVDSDNNILITGYTTVSTNNTDYLLVKLDNNSNQILVRTYDKLLSDVAYSIKCDLQNNIYVTGRTYQSVYAYPPGHYYFESYSATLKFDTYGNQKWVSTNGALCLDCSIDNGSYDLVLDDQQNVFICGESSGRFKTIKYDSLGNMNWIEYYSGLYPNHSIATDIVANSKNNIFISGKAPSEQDNTDIAILKYNNISGNQDWLLTYNNNENKDDIISKMVIDSSDNIFIVGYSKSNISGNNILLLKYSDGTIGINNNNNLIINHYSLSQNYPNPFNPTTNFEFGISELGFVSLKVYNSLGKEVATIVNEVLSPGSYNYQFSTVNYQLSSGIYFYKLESGGFVETKRMVLIK